MEEKQYVTEWANENLGLTLKITKMLHEEQTPYQKIQIADTLEYGRLLILTAFSRHPSKMNGHITR